ncbi:RloB family protein [Saccharopolyspora flava]|uniref:RloB-like protein n=1 Tax=Saccharopolyspora flava TaxID=95161 RepID=A0A1I6P8K0_9PSEU|nr:RloB family protein [Saccharopolyspora flava]SFS36513.1 RloB-like protein [Saccharopolyspora flava]
MADRPNKRRGRPARQLAKRILVVTEGTLTEPQYVERLNSFLRSRGSTAVVKPVGVGRDPLRVVRKCVEIRDKAAKDDKPFDICVCLVDVDRHEALPSACERAERESILLLVSNVKFEMWLRWHAEGNRSALTSAQLDQRTAKLGLVKNKMLSLSFPFHQVGEACAIAYRADPELRAGRVGPDPSSAMPVLVELLSDR